MLVGIGAALAMLSASPDLAAAPTALQAPNRRMKPELWLEDAPNWMGNATTRARVKVHVIVSKEGRANHCSIVDTSGNGFLDRAVCLLVTVNGRYQPATDAGGTPTDSDDTMVFVINPDLQRLARQDTYPMEAFRRNQQGAVHARLRIGIDGRVKSCAITISSKSASLDEATCQGLTTNFREIPPQDADGNYLEDEREQVVNWEIPQDR